MLGNIELTEFAYKYTVHGIGMLPNLQDGETVLIDPCVEPINSDMVLVEIAGEQSIMQLWRVAGESWLTFSNPTFSDIKKPFSSAFVLGVVMAIWCDPISVRGRLR